MTPSPITSPSGGSPVRISAAWHMEWHPGCKSSHQKPLVQGQPGFPGVRGKYVKCCVYVCMCVVRKSGRHSGSSLMNWPSSLQRRDSS